MQLAGFEKKNLSNSSLNYTLHFITFEECLLYFQLLIVASRGAKKYECRKSVGNQ